MKLDVKIQLLNFFFEVFNFFFLALGLSVCGVGLWILFDGGSLLTVHASDELRVVGAGLMLIGLVVLAVGVVGVVGAVKDVRVLLLVYLGFLIVLVLGQLFVTLLLLINRDKIDRSLDETVDQIIFDYGGHSSSDTLLDKIQSYEDCCGYMNPSDWLKNSYIQSLNLTNPDVLPCSCFRIRRPAVNSSWCSTVPNFTAPLYGRGNGSHHQGCRQKVTDWLQENFLTIVGMDVALMLIQVVQFVFTVCLYRALGRRAAVKVTDRLSDPEDDPDHDPDYDPEDDPDHDPDYDPEDDPDYGEQNYAYVDPDDGYPGYHHDHQDYD